MFGNPFGEDESSQRLWNMIAFKIPLTDREFEEAAPIILIILAIIVIVIWAAY